MPNPIKPGPRPCGCGKPHPVPPPPPPHPGPCPEPPICQPFTPTEFQFMSIEDVRYLMGLIKTELDANAGADQTYARELVEAEETARKAKDDLLDEAINTKANAADVYSKTDADDKFFLNANVAADFSAPSALTVPSTLASYTALNAKLNNNLGAQEAGKLLAIN